MGCYDTSEHSRTHGHRLKTAYPRLDFVESGFRYYNSAIGRWPSRDPIEERGGLMVYGFLGNSPIDRFDFLGLWGGDEHSLLTEAVFKMVTFPDDFPEQCKESMLEQMITANLDQDASILTLRFSRNLTRRQRHFMRRAFQDRTVAREEYTKYLKGLETTFHKNLLNPTPQTCAASLDALGRLTHSWQDFYSHGVGVDPRTDFAVFDLWTARPSIRGTPESPGQIFPSQYGGEHYTLGEFIIPDTLEYELRFGAALDFVNSKLRDLIPKYIEACHCFCE